MDDIEWAQDDVRLPTRVRSDFGFNARTFERYERSAGVLAPGDGISVTYSCYPLLPCDACLSLLRGREPLSGSDFPSSLEHGTFSLHSCFIVRPSFASYTAAVCTATRAQGRGHNSHRRRASHSWGRGTLAARVPVLSTTVEQSRVG